MRRTLTDLAALDPSLPLCPPPSPPIVDSKPGQAQRLGQALGGVGGLGQLSTVHAASREGYARVLLHGVGVLTLARMCHANLDNFAGMCMVLPGCISYFVWNIVSKANTRRVQQLPLLQHTCIPVLQREPTSPHITRFVFQQVFRKVLALASAAAAAWCTGVGYSAGACAYTQSSRCT